MNNDLERQIAIMQHFAKGKEVEIFTKDKGWSVINNKDFSNWNFGQYDFRIKEQKKTVTIEKWLCKNGDDSYYIVETSHIDGYEKVKLLDSYEVEI